jgi:uncharacterized protein YlxP (DUF503 family)
VLGKHDARDELAKRFGGVMIVGAAAVEIHVHESQSLKAKRGVVRSIAGRLRSRFNVSVGEVGGQGTWQRAVIGLAMTGSDEVSLRRALEKVVTAIEDMHLAQVIASEIEMIRLPITEEAGGWAVESDELEDDLPWDRS